MRRKTAMKKIAVFLVWLCSAGLSWGATLGDVNNDGDIGLPEAIYALQTSAGIRPQGVVAQYDFAEYFPIVGTFENRIKNYRDEASGGSYTVQGITEFKKETVDGTEYISDGFNYYQITPKGVFGVGYKSGGEIVWDDPIQVGSRTMSIGDHFTVFYETSPGSGVRTFREDIFLGTEDVTTAAGVFPACLKMMVKEMSSSSSTAYLRYYARGVGKVKQEFLATPYASSSSMELVSADINGNTFPAGVVYYTGSGTWSEPEPSPGRTGDFTFQFSLGTLPAWGKLTLKGFVASIPPNTPSDYTFILSSEDGIHFSDAWYASVYPSYVSRCSLTVSDGNITGDSFITTALIGTYAPEQ